MSRQIKKETKVSELHKNGRGSKIRTHNTRFWRPMFYQLNYTPINASFELFIKFSESCYLAYKIVVPKTGFEPAQSDKIVPTFYHSAFKLLGDNATEVASLRIKQPFLLEGFNRRGVFLLLSGNYIIPHFIFFVKSLHNNLPLDCYQSGHH
jgi:hypothetical protein